MIIKNSIKLLVFSALLLLMPLAVNAQDNDRALAAAVEDIVLSDMDPKVVNEFVEEIYKKHCKTAYLASRIAKAYYMYSDDPTTKERIFGRREPDTAFVYINRAIAINPKYPDPYILASDIVKYETSYGERPERINKAMEWLNRGIAQNPTDSSLYMAQAEILAFTNAEAAVAKLQELKTKDPNFPVDLKLARMYYKIFDNGGSAEERFNYLSKMVEHYEKADKALFTMGDYGSFAMGCTFTNKYDLGVEIANSGLEKYPEDFALNKFCLASAVRIKRWDDCVSAVDRILKNNPDKMDNIMYIQYGIALTGKKQFEKGLEQFEKVLANKDLSEDNKKLAESQIAATISAQVNEVRKQGDYDKAIAIIKPYIDKNKAKGVQNDNLMLAYANIYQDWAEELNGLEKKEKLMKADEIFVDAIKNIQVKDNASLFAYYRVGIYFKIDGKAETGEALPAITQLEYLLSSTDEAFTGFKASRLVLGYGYAMSYYAFVKNDYDTALKYADKILSIEPTNERALKFSEALSKGRRRR